MEDNGRSERESRSARHDAVVQRGEGPRCIANGGRRPHRRAGGRFHARSQAPRTLRWAGGSVRKRRRAHQCTGIRGRPCAAPSAPTAEPLAMGAKKQQTFAKLQRERRVKEKRQLKLEKKQAAALRKLEGETGESLTVGDDSLDVNEEAVAPLDEPAASLEEPAASPE